MSGAWQDLFKIQGCPSTYGRGKSPSTVQVVIPVEMLVQDDGHSPWLHFSKGVSDGLYKKHDVLLGMMKAMIKKAEC